MNHKRATILITVLCLMQLIGCAERGDSSKAFVLAENTPNSFLSYINSQASLGAGQYQLFILPKVQLTDSDSKTAQYQIDLTINGSDNESDNESDENTLIGDWGGEDDRLSAGYTDWQLTTHPPIDVDLAVAGGLIANIKCDLPCNVFLVRNDYLIRSFESELSASSSSNSEVSLDLPQSQINSLAYTNAYHQAVDSIQTRTNLTDWQSHNGFDQGQDSHVIFRDTKDLGYGRDMYSRERDDGFASTYVRNYIVALTVGDPSNYGPLNVLAANDANPDYHAGSNTIEYSLLDDSDVANGYALKFFTFTPPNSGGVQQRLNAANLDGRGIKFMPGPCFVCHGGRLLPLYHDGSFSPLVLNSTKLNQLDKESFEFLDEGPHDKDNIESGIRFINREARNNYQDTRTDQNQGQGFWSSSFAEEIANLRYGDSDYSSQLYLTNTIPAGWLQSQNRPEGVETLYKSVVEPFCISCHSLRGYGAGEDGSLDTTRVSGIDVRLGTAINFSSYEKFISYRDRIVEYVYQRGIMPLSLRNYEAFWQSNNNAPKLLASYLEGFDSETMGPDGLGIINSAGEFVQPGRPVADPGPDRISKSPVRLDASSSAYAEEYRWQVISSPEGSSSSFSEENGRITDFVADTSGTYEITLTVSNSKISGIKKSIQIIVNNQLAKHGNELNFVDDIKPLLQNTVLNGRTCQSCHNEVDGVGIKGIPVYFSATNDYLYEDVRARVNLANPSLSRLLQKPTQVQHGGGIRFDVSDPMIAELFSQTYDWILHGAPCGADSMICKY